MSPSQIMDENYTMLQGFEWFVPNDQKHWSRLHHALAGLKAIGVDNIWIPPGCKANSQGNGYDTYDLYDLGEFNQKGHVPTKWGLKSNLKDFVAEAKRIGIGIYWDAVLNHKAGADRQESTEVIEVELEGK